MALEQKKQPGREAYEWVQILVCSVLAVVLVFTFAVRGFRVDGPSMRETLQDGDMLLVLNDGLCGDYQPGDIVILRKASFRDGKPIVKRVIATEGQTVKIDYDLNEVSVEDVTLEEPYLNFEEGDPMLPRDERSVVSDTVPEGCVFVMGDNRNHSADSRSEKYGMIDKSRIVGRVVLPVLS